MISVSSDVIDKIIKIVRDGGGEVFENDGYINFCGVRNNATNDTFNDELYIYWKDVNDGKFKCVKTSGFTTKPGKKAVLNTSGKTNSKGVAIVKEGWHPDIWHHGVHGGKHKALRQDAGVTKPITITRDKTQFGQNTNTYELRIFSDTTESGYPYTNMHRSGDPQGNSVNGWSEGCQVFKYKNEFEEMLSMADYATSRGQDKFSYFLTNKTVFDEEDVVDDKQEEKPYDFEDSQFANSMQQNNTSQSSSNTSQTSQPSQSSQYSNSTSSSAQPSNNVPNLGKSGMGGNSSSGSFSKANTDSSFGKEVIFGKVFPEDDNNKYIDMPSDDISVIQYSEHSLKLDDLRKYDKDKASTKTLPDKISYYIPVVYINDFIIPQTNITNFCLDYSSFVPQVMVEFVDISNDLLSTNIPKPGSYIKVYIGGYGDEKYYKPIRQDFVITNINKTNRTYGEYQNYPNSGNPIKYKLTGILNVPIGLIKMPWSSSKINARQAMFNMSTTVGIGFATNFEINSNVDVMRWVNTQNKSYYDFMKEITQHSCYSPYTFFTSFIDQYYVLNYVECHRLLSHGGDKKDTPQMIYNCIIPDMEKEDKPDDEMNSGSQKLSYYFLSNSLEFKGWTNYIEEYYVLNDGYSLISDGYCKELTYSDKCGFFDLTSKNYKFLITPIDNLKRDGDKVILSLPSKEQLDYDTYIPLNLRQTTNSAYIENQNLYDKPTAAETLIDIGEVDTSNSFPLYYYASVQNDFQMKNLKKCGLSIRLQNYNPAITKYSRIWIDIYDMNKNSSTQIRKDPTIDGLPPSKWKTYLKEKNDNIIVFKNDFEKDTDEQIYNRSLSGWYVVTDMKISYNTVKDFKGVTSKKLQTHLILNRIEYKPSFYNEYEMARNAVEKYKTENVPESIMCGGDIL